jgi:hypothetical protein
MGKKPYERTEEDVLGYRRGFQQAWNVLAEAILNHDRAITQAGGVSTLDQAERMLVDKMVNDTRPQKKERLGQLNAIAARLGIEVPTD